MWFWKKNKEDVVIVEAHPEECECGICITLTAEAILAKELYDACMSELLNNPDITESDALSMLDQIVDQATNDEGELRIKKFEELFTGTLQSMGITTTLFNEEVSMADVMSRGRLSALRERVKGIKLKVPENWISNEDVGVAIGEKAGKLARPLVSIAKGIKKGWKSA